MGLVLSSTPRTIAEKREIPLRTQIDEAARDLQLRLFPERRPKGRTPQNQVGLLIERQEAIVTTLHWVRDHEQRLLEWLATLESPPASGARVPLWKRVKEAEHELQQRRSWDWHGSKRPAESDHTVGGRAAAQEAILETLVWVQAIRPAFEAWLAERASPEAEGASA